MPNASPAGYYAGLSGIAAAEVRWVLITFDEGICDHVRCSYSKPTNFFCRGRGIRALEM